ncbi:MAG: FtsQ-type POTRA domain-containing protein [Terriglobales bacterium]
MARKSSSTAVQEELYPLPNEAPEREPFDDARLIDLEAEQESPFLRGQKRVPARRGSLPKKTAHRLLWICALLIALLMVGSAGWGLYRYGEHSWRFRIDSSDQIEVTGADHVAHSQIMEVMGGDIGRNIFFVPLAQRKQQLEQIPWVESASVMRFAPNRLRLEIRERTPVAFARVGSHISLIDAGGTLMELAPGLKRKYSFAVVLGINSGEPLAARAARMKNYNQLVQELDSGGAHYSQELGEVDLSDPEDVKILVADSNGGVLVHLGSGNYLSRYRAYVARVQQFRQQFDKIESVDLRYDGQIIVNPDLQGIARQPALTPTAAKAAVAAGVKTAAIVNYEKYVNRPAPASPAAPAKKQAKTKAKAGIQASAHRGATKTVPAKPAPHSAAAKQAPASPAAALKMTAKPAKVLPHRAAPSPPGASSSAAAKQKKPSAAIPKEAAQN